MRDKIFDHLLLTSIVAVCGMGVTFIRDMSQNLHSLTVSVQELNSKMGAVHDTIKDHEQRLRAVELKGARRR